MGEDRGRGHLTGEFCATFFQLLLGCEGAGRTGRLARMRGMPSSLKDMIRVPTPQVDLMDDESTMTESTACVIETA